MKGERKRKRFNVAEFYRMAEMGVFAGSSMELLHGDIIERSPTGPRRSAALTRAVHVLLPLLQRKALVRPQLPLRLNELSEVRPDVGLFKPRRDYYEARHPRAEDVLMALEISDTTLGFDRDVKLDIYAAARIPEVWIADLVGDTLLVFRKPSHQAYRTSQVLHRGDSATMLAFPDISIPVADLLARGSGL